MTYTTDHLADIKAGKVTKRNVIGIRKAINADARRRHPWNLSVSSTAPKRTHSEVVEIESALAKREPRVVGDLHDSGLKILKSPRWRRNFDGVAHLAAAVRSFHLVRFDRTGDEGLHCVPVYRAASPKGSFLFRNIPWQSGGNGPEVVR